MIEPEAELPKWQTHRVVSAAKIEKIERRGSSGLYLLHLEGGLHVHVTYTYAERHTPFVGGYFIRHGDGFESFAPKKVFEDSYERVK
jgi:hypothetical protein